MLLKWLKVSINGEGDKLLIQVWKLNIENAHQEQTELLRKNFRFINLDMSDYFEKLLNKTLSKNV